MSQTEDCSLCYLLASDWTIVVYLPQKNAFLGSRLLISHNTRPKTHRRSIQPDQTTDGFSWHFIYCFCLVQLTFWMDIFDSYEGVRLHGTTTPHPAQVSIKLSTRAIRLIGTIWDAIQSLISMSGAPQRLCEMKKRNRDIFSLGCQLTISRPRTTAKWY
jgi:hypothetical protein